MQKLCVRVCKKKKAMPEVLKDWNAYMNKSGGTDFAHFVFMLEWLNNVPNLFNLKVTPLQLALAGFFQGIDTHLISCKSTTLPSNWNNQIPFDCLQIVKGYILKKTKTTNKHECNNVIITEKWM